MQPHFLVAESRFASRELSGLDEPVEIFAVDPVHSWQPADEIAAPWGRFWSGLMEANALHSSAGCTPAPEEGGLILRPLRNLPSSDEDAPSMWTADHCRLINVPERSVHKEAGWPSPVSISNETFIELRYSLSPSLIVNFDFADLREGIFRAFAVPLPDGDAMCRLLLVLDPEAIQSTFSLADACKLGASSKAGRRARAPAGDTTRSLSPTSSASSSSRSSSSSSAAAAHRRARAAPSAADVATAERLSRFLAVAAGAPPSAHWSSTIEAAAAATLDAAASASAEGSEVTDHRLNLFAHQRRSLAWMRCVEAADPVAGGSSVHVEPLAIAGRTFGSAYEVRLPAGGVVGHPPGAGKTRIAAALIAERAADTTLMAPGHLLPHWEEELSVALGRHGAPIMNVDAPADGTRGQELLGYHWEGVLLIGYHALAAAQDGAIDDDDDDDDDDNGGGEPEPAAIRLLGVRLRTARLIIDEPQDIPSAMHSAVIDRLAPLYRTRWVLCGTAHAHLRTIGPLLMGARRWRMASTVDEWRGQPTMCHVYRHRFLRDPPWACLPQPPLHVVEERVTPSQEEAVAAQMAALSGFVVDSVLLLSLGQKATALAVQERQQLARSSQQASRRAQRRRAAAAAARHLDDAIHRLPLEGAVPLEGAGAPAADEDATQPTAISPEDPGVIAGGDGYVYSDGSEDEDDDDDDDDDVEAMSAVIDADVGSLSGSLSLSSGSAAQALPVSEWTAVEAQQRERLARVDARLRKLQAKLEAQAKAFVLGDGGPGNAGGLLERLAFLQADALALQWARTEHATSFDGGQGSAEVAGRTSWREVAPSSLAGAEWNADLDAAGGEAIKGRVARLASVEATAEAVTGDASDGAGKPVHAHTLNSGMGALLLASESEAGGDFCGTAWRAHRQGALALLVACDGEVTRPMGYASEQTAPPIPAAMLPRSVAEAMLEAAGGPASQGVVASLRVLKVAAIHEDMTGGGGGVDEGVMADVVALDDATSQRLHNRMVLLASERERLVASLRFASRVQLQLSAHASSPRGPPGGLDAELVLPLSALAAPPQDAAVDGVQVEAEVGGQGMAAEGASAIVDSLSTTPTCPICFDQARAVCVLPECFHSLCRACLQRASAGSASFKCPLCRTRVLTWTVTVFRTALATEEETSVIPPGLRIPSVVWRTLPSKLQRLLSLVNTILSADDNECGTEAVGGGDGCGDKQAASASPQGARILIYTQWLAHVEFIGQLLGSAHIESLRMSGDLGRCMQALQQFGTPGAPRVLVLSSQHHASGINLQVARHVILLHPYCTPSATYPEAVSFSSLKAFEQQAVGRVRRYPQTKPVVVYRLYAADTVEEVLYRGGYAEMGAPAASPETREA